MPGLVPGITVFMPENQGANGREKPGHDDDGWIGETIASAAGCHHARPPAKSAARRRAARPGEGSACLAAFARQRGRVHELFFHDTKLHLKDGTKRK
jgi:hypothetical protein